MPGAIVPYARFLEVRQRRQGAVTELARQPVTTPNEHSRDGHAVTLECAAVASQSCGTRSDPATSGAEDRGYPDDVNA